MHLCRFVFVEGLVDLLSTCVTVGLFVCLPVGLSLCVSFCMLTWEGSGVQTESKKSEALRKGYFILNVDLESLAHLAILHFGFLAGQTQKRESGAVVMIFKRSQGGSNCRP